MMKIETATPKTEAIGKETKSKIEYYFYDSESKPIHTSRIIYKNADKIIIFPFSYTESAGLKKKKISEIELRGWSNFNEIPKLIRPGKNVSLGHKRIAPLMRLLYSRYPRLEKLIIIRQSGKTRFSDKTVTFALQDLENICKAISKELTTFEVRRRIATQNALAGISNVFDQRINNLARGSLSHFLSHYGGEYNLSLADVDALLRLIVHAPLGNVTVTQNFIATKNRVNVTYLDGVIENYETLLTANRDNEKDWQEFFFEHGWILASVFPYQVILNQREAYVGGKTIENKEGRVVDFLYQNGFRDNYALLEVKTHKKKLLRARAYREPDAFSQHEDCSGAIAQCLDQKNTFLTEMGHKYTTLDPRVVLIIGMKSELNDNQARGLELLRNNQKNIDIVTFDEVLEKIRGLRSILRN